MVGKLITTASPMVMSIKPVRLLNATSQPFAASPKTTPVASSSFL